MAKYHLLLDGSFTSISALTSLLPVAVGILLWSRLSPIQRAIWLLPVWFIVAEIWNGSLLAREFFDPPTNLPYFHLVAPVQFILLLNVYRDHLRRLVGKDWFWPLVISFWLLALISVFFIDGLYAANSTTLAAISLSGMGLAVSYLFRQLQVMEVRRLDRDPLFWVTVGWLFYFAGSFLLFLGLNYLANQFTMSAFDQLFNIHGGLTIFLNVTYCLSLWIKPVKTE